MLDKIQQKKQLEIFYANILVENDVYRPEQITKDFKVMGDSVEYVVRDKTNNRKLVTISMSLKGIIRKPKQASDFFKNKVFWAKQKRIKSGEDMKYLLKKWGFIFAVTFGLILFTIINLTNAQETEQYIYGKCTPTYVDDTLHCETRLDLCFVSFDALKSDGTKYTRFVCKKKIGVQDESN